MENLTLEKRQLCDIQGRLFELALKNDYDCPFFIEALMNSKAAAALDDVYDRLQWVLSLQTLKMPGNPCPGIFSYECMCMVGVPERSPFAE